MSSDDRVLDTVDGVQRTLRTFVRGRWIEPGTEFTAEGTRWVFRYAIGAGRSLIYLCDNPLHPEWGAEAEVIVHPATISVVHRDRILQGDTDA